MPEPQPEHLPEPPYYAVTFIAVRSTVDGDGYAIASTEMEALVQEQPGYLGLDTVTGPDGMTISVAYFRDEESIKMWRDQPDHAKTRELGRERWFDAYAVHVGRIERSYRWERETTP